MEILTVVLGNGVLTGGLGEKLWLRGEIDAKHDDEPTGCGKNEGGAESTKGDLGI